MEIKNRSWGSYSKDLALGLGGVALIKPQMTWVFPFFACSKSNKNLPIIKKKISLPYLQRIYNFL